MTEGVVRFPGQQQRPDNWTPPPTTAARSWAELIETLKGGLATLDRDWRLSFVSDRFLPILGQAGDLVGHDVRRLIPALAPDDPRALATKFTGGSIVEFDQTYADGDRIHWFHIRIIPVGNLDEDVIGVVFANDTSPTSRSLAQLRDATVELTEIESQLFRRVGRDVHDGPVQILAALMFTLGLTDVAEADEFERDVSSVASMLRDVIAEISPDPRRPSGSLIGQWVAPLLIDTEITLDVEDLRSSSAGQSEAQAAFVLLYQVVLAVKRIGGPRSLHLRLTDESGGERVELRFRSAAPQTISVGRAAAQYRTILHHARSIGGTLTTTIDDNDVRTMSMWIPKRSVPRSDHAVVSPPTQATKRPVPTNDVSDLPPLTSAIWRALARAAPERLIEFDEQMRISFTNGAQQEMVGAAPEQLIGLRMDEMFPVESLTRLNSTFERLGAGEFVETEWERDNVMRDARLVHLTASPRLDDAGRFKGVLVASDDRTNVALLESLYQTALSDLTEARRMVIERSIRLLDRPLSECERLIDRLQDHRCGVSHLDSVRHIIAELETALQRIKRSTGVLGASPPHLDELEPALRQSLGSVLGGRRLIVIDKTESAPTYRTIDVVFRIAREAVNNAVIHGRANVVTITLADDDLGLSCEIHDDGIGVDPELLRPRPGHLGTRAMHERARERGGTCRIEPDPRGGTLVSVQLPERAVTTSLIDASSS